MAYARGHARREELAREQGFASYREKRNATPEQRAAAAARMIETNPTYARAAGHQIGRQAVGGRRQIFETPAGVVVSTKRADVLRSQVRQAAQRDEVVRVTYTIDRGNGPEQRELWGRGGYSAERFFDRIEDDYGGDVADAIADFDADVYGGGGGAVTGVTITASPT